MSLQTTVPALRNEPAPIAARGPWTIALHRLRRDKVAMASLGVIVLMTLVAVFAPLVQRLTGHSPDVQYHRVGLTADGLPRPPTSTFWFGTDDLGRDVLVRVAYGARVSLGVGVVATLLSVAVGMALGLAAGYLGGIVDSLLARAIDVVLSIPFLLVAIALVSITGPSLLVTILVISFFSWSSMARIVRGQVLSVTQREYVEAARSTGAGDLRIMVVEVLPNVMAPVIVYTTLLIPVVIVVQATLSFLGLGLPPPTPDWGGMISEAQPYYQTSWWFLAAPGAALVIATVAFNLFGDGVRDAFDPGRARLTRA
jgi:ABC-type dipeptide/oligopeptide/nickel transport system permease subunit